MPMLVRQAEDGAQLTHGDGGIVAQPVICRFDVEAIICDALREIPVRLPVQRCHRVIEHLPSALVIDTGAYVYVE